MAKRAVRMSRQQHVRDRNGRQLRVYRHTEVPNRWNAEVVRALSSRLPGGKTTPLTIKCEDCGSEFYPCLCTAREKRTPHVRSLRSPRIVELAEEDGTKGGNLSLVRESGGGQGMDRSRLVVFDEAGKSQGRFAARVCHRKKDEYIVHQDYAQPLTQRLELEALELKHLLPCLDDSLAIHHGSGFTKEIAVDYGSQRDAEGDIEIRNVRGELLVHSLAPDGRAYRAGVRVCHGLATLEATERMTRLPKGVAGYSIERSTSWEMLDPFAWLPKEFRASPSQPDMSVGPHGQPVAASSRHLDGLDWPCRLTFNALPSGWRLVREVVCGGGIVQLKHESFRGIAREDRGATLEFECMPKHAVGRGDSSARHEHVRERQICATPEHDARMVECWIMNMRLTPAQLGFVLRRLLDALRCELAAFDGHRADLDAMLRAKIRRSLEIESTLAQQKDMPIKVLAFFRTELDSTRSEVVQITNKVPAYYLKELCCKGVTFQYYRLVPTKIRDVAAFTDADRSAVHLSTIKLRLSGIDVEGCCSEMAISRDGARAVLTISLQKPTVVNSYMLQTAGDDPLRDPVRWRFEGSHDNFDESVCVLHSLVQDAAVPLERNALTQEFPLMQSETLETTWEPGSLKGRARSLNPQGGVAQHLSRRRPAAAEDGAATITDDHVSLELAKSAHIALNPWLPDRKAKALHALAEKEREGSDGQLSVKEFQRVIYDSGITWLKETEVQEMFDSIDINGNGKLNLGEVLGAAARLSDLVRRCYSHCGESVQISSEAAVASLEATTLPEMLEQFSEKVLLGEDLVAAIPDTSITASSCNPDAGCQAEGSMGQSRIDFAGAAWVADGHAGDASPWISWDLGGSRLVTAVLTRGCPEPELWVTRYNLEYMPPFRGSLGSAADADWLSYEHQGVSCELAGNADCDSLQQSRLEHPFEATHVRLRPLRWFPSSGGNGPAMRASLLGFPLGADGRRLAGAGAREALRLSKCPLPRESHDTISALPTFT